MQERKSMNKVILPFMLSLLMCCSSLLADDWPHWLGSSRDGVWHETGIVTKIPAEGLPVKWRVPIAGGYSGPAVANGKVFVTDFQRLTGDATNGPSLRTKITGIERLHCLDRTTGKKLWTHKYPCSYYVSYPSGPRATPAVSDGRVYSLGTEGNLICLDVQSGKLVWQKELKKEYGIKTPVWGF